MAKKKENADYKELISKLVKFDLFSGLDTDQLRELATITKVETCSRGASIITEGEIGNSLYFILSGRFEIRVEASSERYAEIGPGQPIGEVAFITGCPRTATVTAMRESIVLVLEKERFEQICDLNPSIWRALSVALAKRLAASNKGWGEANQSAFSTIAIIPAGSTTVPQQFIERFVASLAKTGRTLLITSSNAGDYVGQHSGTVGHDLISALNGLETRYDRIVYVADPEMTHWSRIAIKQADLILAVGEHASSGGFSVPLNEHEDFARSFHPIDSQRLILLHHNKEIITGTSHWLKARQIKMHHHLCLSETDDYARLVRFLQGEAIGLVTCGGGALCCAHLGVYQAMTQAGIAFDIFGGTSGGSAMAAAFVLGLDPAEIERLTYDMFVTQQALGRYNLPVFSLLDHRHFDEQLKRLYGNVQIEDCWRPYFAVASDLSNGRPVCIGEGSLWQAIRASSSLPALLPPFYTGDGEMLVDGALVDNVPVSAMHEMKEGPNVVVSFEQSRQILFPVDYRDIPSRSGLVRSALVKQRREQLRKLLD